MIIKTIWLILLLSLMTETISKTKYARRNKNRRTKGGHWWQKMGKEGDGHAGGGSPPISGGNPSGPFPGTPIPLPDKRSTQPPPTKPDIKPTSVTTIVTTSVTAKVTSSVKVNGMRIRSTRPSRKLRSTPGPSLTVQNGRTIQPKAGKPSSGHPSRTRKINTLPTPTRRFLHTSMNKSKYRPTITRSTKPTGTSKYNTHPTPSRKSSPTQRSPTVHGKITSTKLPTKPNTTRKPKGNNEALAVLLKQKVTKENAKEVAKNLTKIFAQSKPEIMTKDDAIAVADVLENVVSIKEKLNETAGNVVEFIDSFMEINKTTLAESEDAASKIIKVLENLVEYVPLTDNTTSLKINKTNIVIQANLVQPETFTGIKFGVDSHTTRSTERPRNGAQYSMQLPRDVVMSSNSSSTRIGFIFYANNKLFQTNNSDQREPSETVLSGSVFGSIVNNLIQPVVIRLPLDNGRHRDDDKTNQCVFWVESDREWSSAGCSLCTKQSSDDSIECCCNHLTSFAVLFSPEKKTKVDDVVHANILSIISYVGCIISLIGVTLTFLTYSLFSHLRKTNQQPILMNLCIAIALLLIVFLAGINSTNHELGCQIVAVLLHYLTLVTVLWMGIEAYNLYLQIVKVMAIYHRKFMLKAAIIGWGIPMIIVLATLASAIIQYQQNDGKETFYYGNKQMCILHNELYRQIAWFGPVLGIICMNFIAFSLIVYKLNSRYTMIPAAPKSKHLKNCWTSVAIMCLLGVTWLFGALAISDARIIFEYLFCIFNSLQGFFIFVFHCVRIKEVRNQWSFFVSGLGFSRGNSENSQHKSRVVEKLRKSTDSMCMNKVGNIKNDDKKEPKRKTTVVTWVVEEENGKTNDIEVSKTHSSCSHYSTQF